MSNVSLGERAVPNSIGYYLDEFSVGTIAAGTINPSMVDVQRVEVLRGPQGTYFGRNATGGALNISSNLPDNKWFAEVSGYGGNYDSWGGHLIVNAPVSDTLFLRGSVAYDSSDGIVKNVNPNGTPNSGYDTTNARMSARWLSTDKFTADFSFTVWPRRARASTRTSTPACSTSTPSASRGRTSGPSATGSGSTRRTRST